jgi:hypothetical protein
MTTLTAIYLVLTAVMFLTCMAAYALDKAADEVFTASAVILLFASMSTLIHMWFPPPWSQAGSPVQDLLCVILFLGAWRSTGGRWAVALVIMFLIQISVHFGYWITDDFSVVARRDYAIKINAIYCGELAVLFFTGGGYVVRHCRNVLGLSRGRALADPSRVR